MDQQGNKEECIPGLYAVTESWIQKTPLLSALSAHHRPDYYIGKYIFAESFCAGCLVDRQVVFFELVLNIILQMFEYQISSYPPKKVTTFIHGDSDLLSVVPGVVMMGLSHAAQFQLLKIS